MTLNDIDNEMEARHQLAKEFCEKMNKWGYHIDVAIQHLGDYLKMDNITRTSASWLIINSAETIRGITNLMDDVKNMAKECVLKPVERLWDDDIEGKLKALASLVDDVAQKSERTSRENCWRDIGSEFEVYEKVEENVVAIAKVVVDWIEKLRKEMNEVTATMNDPVRKAKRFDDILNDLNADGNEEDWWLMDNDGKTLVDMAALREELKLALIFGNNHIALISNLMKNGCTERQLLTVMEYVRMTDMMKARHRNRCDSTELVAAVEAERDRRFAYAVGKVKDEGLIKFGYDWTWIELYCEGALTDAQFSAPKSFLSYLSVLGVDSLPDRSTLAKKVDVVMGVYPNWTFNDTKNASETMRRKRIVGRFIFHYNNFSRQ